MRFAGLLLVVAYFYLQAGRAGVTAFFPWTIHARVATGIIFLCSWRWARPRRSCLSLPRPI